jgi:DNA-binding PadR family transcriptional regulator
MGRAQERVLQAIANGRRYGFEIMVAAGMSSGAVYQALAGLERGGYVRSRWEDPDIAERARRPRRRYYAISRSGEHALAEVAERYRAFQRDMPARFSTDPGYDTTA